MRLDRTIITLPQFNTITGLAFTNTKLGVSHSGTLNGAGDNVVVVFHYLTGDAKFAGKYDENEKRPGYWDAHIGPGKLIDTEKYFVVSVDCPGNFSPYRETVVAPGPSDLGPEGQPFGSRFLITFQDQVDMITACLDQIGVKHVHLAMGLSMGGCHALEFAATRPDAVNYVLGIATGLYADQWLSQWCHVMEQAIRDDRDLSNAYLLGKAEVPRYGVEMALRIITQYGRSNAYTERFGRDSESGEFEILNDIDGGAKARAKVMCPYSAAAMFRALGTWSLGRNRMARTSPKDSMAAAARRIRAKLLMTAFGDDDLLFAPDLFEASMRILRESATPVEVFRQSGTLGHSDLGAAFNAPQLQAALQKIL